MSKLRMGLLQSLIDDMHQAAGITSLDSMEVIRANVPKCPELIFIKQANEVPSQDAKEAAAFFSEYAGKQLRRIVRIADADGFYGTTLDGITVRVKRIWVEQRIQHTFKDHGCRKSWCEHCNAVGEFNWRTGGYEAA